MKSACCQFLDSLPEANLTGTVPFADLSSLEIDLVLVSMFGLRGVNAIRIALQTVPSELPVEDRIHYISNIVEPETSSTLSVSINTSDVIGSFIPHSDKLPFFHLLP